MVTVGDGCLVTIVYMFVGVMLLNSINPVCPWARLVTGAARNGMQKQNNRTAIPKLITALFMSFSNKDFLLHYAVSE